MPLWVGKFHKTFLRKCNKKDLLLGKVGMKSSPGSRKCMCRCSVICQGTERNPTSFGPCDQKQENQKMRVQLGLGGVEPAGGQGP